jgi:hypothetical protein
MLRPATSSIARERIIAAEVMKLELRQATARRHQTRTSSQRDAADRRLR